MTENRSQRSSDGGLKDPSQSASTARRSGGSARGGTPGGAPGTNRGEPLPLINARWLAGALVGTLCLVALCLYSTVCLLFWLGQWQIVFGRSQPITVTPAKIGLRYDDIRFDATETGILQLHGWWIPAGAGAPYAGDTFLFLRDPSGSLSDSVAQLAALHNIGLNVFAFDYRGFGTSAKVHPSEKSVSGDADAAWYYLTGTRHLAPATIVIYGVKLGAAVAAEAALGHPQAPALILQDLEPPMIVRLERNPRLRYLPVRLLFHDRFDPTQTLGRVAIPKLFLSRSQELTSTGQPLYFDRAAGPKTSAILEGPAGAQPQQAVAYQTSINRFLKKYLPASSR